MVWLHSSPDFEILIMESLSEHVIVYRYNLLKLLGFAILGLGMTLVSSLVALRVLPIAEGSFGQFVGFIATLLFFAVTCFFIWRLVTAGGPIVTITETGITDLRLAAEEISWSAIWHHGVAQAGRQRLLVVDVDPAFEKTLTLTRTVRWSRPANSRLGISGLATSAHGLNVDLDTLVNECFKRRPNR